MHRIRELYSMHRITILLGNGIMYYQVNLWKLSYNLLSASYQFCMHNGIVLRVSGWVLGVAL
jgi:hypothetical protein